MLQKDSVKARTPTNYKLKQIMLESTPDKAGILASEETLIMTCNDTDPCSGKHLTVESNIDVLSAQKKQKENFNDGMKVHNFTECCR